jgi:hypothetical protein
VLIFTDAQVQILSQDMYDYPTNLASLNDDLAAITAAQGNWLDRDNANAVYTSNFIDILGAYHDELKYISGNERTDYDLADIDPAGRLAPNNIHFPSSPMWIWFEPKVDPSNLGNPISPWANTENAAILTAESWIDLLKNGFTDGAASTTSTSGFITDLINVTSTAGFTVNDRVILIDGANYLYGVVTQVAGLLLRISIVISSAGYGGIGVGATIENFHIGFTFGQLELGVGAGAGDSAFMAGLKVQADNAVMAWESRITAVEAALIANTAVGTLYTENQTELGLVQGHISDINTWQGFPPIGVGTSRFGTNLPAFESSMNARQLEFSPRTTQILNALGGITQPGISDGSFTGSGQYLELFKNLDLRLNKTSGSLRTYYDTELAISAVQSQLDILNAIQVRDSTTFNMKKFTANGAGTNTIVVDSVSGLALADTVKVISSTQPVLTATISAISGLSVTLSLVVSTAYTVAQSARIVKQN